MATWKFTSSDSRTDPLRRHERLLGPRNSLLREHGWAPVALVFGIECTQRCIARAILLLITRQSVTREAMLRFARGSGTTPSWSFVRSQARQMLLRSARNRTRKLPVPKIGQFSEGPVTPKKRESQWLGPRHIAGLQDGNAWAAVGGRCFSGRRQESI